MSSTDEHPFDARYKHVLDNHGFGLRFSAGAEFAAEREASRILAHVEPKGGLRLEWSNPDPDTGLCRSSEYVLDGPCTSHVGLRMLASYDRAMLAESLSAFCALESL